MNVKVYTAIFGQYDRIRPYDGGICFTDKAQDVEGWEYRVEKYNTMNARLTARQHKCLSHMFVDAEYTIWHDGNVRLKMKPEDIVERFLPVGYDIATFGHPNRNCIYDEAAEVLRLGYADPEKVDRQMKRYADDGYPSRFGLVETRVVVRRNVQRINQFNVLWWLELKDGACRDQLSFNYVAWKLGIAYNIIPGWSAESDVMEYFFHEKDHGWMSK